MSENEIRLNQRLLLIEAIRFHERRVEGGRPQASRFWHEDIVTVLRVLLAEKPCVCNVGVQRCYEHPNRLWSQEKKIAFRKAWDAKVKQ